MTTTTSSSTASSPSPLLPPPPSSSSGPTTTSSSSSSISSSTCTANHRKALQAQSIRSLRTHSAASLRSTIDGEELGSEKLKALVAKFKQDVENQRQDNSKDGDNKDKHDEEEEEDSESSTCLSSEADEEVVKGSTVVSAANKTVATNEQVRSKLLNRLGIQSAVVQPEANPRRLAIPREPSYELPLNDAGEFENWDNRKLLRRNPFSFFSQKSSSATDSVDSASVGGGGETQENQDKDGDDMAAPAPLPKRRVHFQATVKAHPIPSHSVYSKRMKQTIWSSAQELEENVARNCYEFEAENWNFDNVVDEDDMIWYHGQWVHPVHFADFGFSASAETEIERQ